jgi:hypothetical protein
MDSNEVAPASDPLRIPGSTNAHELIQFLRFYPDGREEVVDGYIWGATQPVRGMRCFWVLEVDSEGAVRRSPAEAVVVASRRHRVGRLAKTRTGLERWMRTAGRFVDIGTAYTETDRRSDTGKKTACGVDRTKPPTSILVAPLDPSIFAALSGDTPPEPLLQ